MAGFVRRDSLGAKNLPLLLNALSSLHTIILDALYIVILEAKRRGSHEFNFKVKTPEILGLSGQG